MYRFVTCLPVRLSGWSVARFHAAFLWCLAPEQLVHVCIPKDIQGSLTSRVTTDYGLYVSSNNDFICWGDSSTNYSFLTMRQLTVAD